MGFALAEYDEASKELKILNSAIIRKKAESYTYLAEQALDDLDLFVVENYIISPKVYGHSHEGDSGETLRMIGAIEMLCHLQEIELVLQASSTKPAGYGFLGKSYKRGKRDMHAFDAMAHLVYYLVTVRRMPPLS